MTKDCPPVPDILTSEARAPSITSDRQRPPHASDPTHTGFRSRRDVGNRGRTGGADQDLPCGVEEADHGGLLHQVVPDDVLDDVLVHHALGVHLSVVVEHIVYVNCWLAARETRDTRTQHTYMTRAPLSTHHSKRTL